MQYVRNISDSVSTAWNSINPATLSGAIDVIVVEQHDGSLMCSPFHVRFGKFSLLRPYEKKVEFKVNGVRQNYSMKLGEGGEAFFVFETTENIPQSMQTSPISSPVGSPELGPQPPAMSLEPDLLALDGETAAKMRSASLSSTPPGAITFTAQKNGLLTPLSTSPEFYATRPKSSDWSWTQQRAHSDDVLRQSARRASTNMDSRDSADNDSSRRSDRSHSPPPLAPREAFERAMMLSKELSSVNIPSRVTESGDLMLDMTGFKDSEEDAIRAEVLARRVLSNELQGNYDVGALFGMDEQGNLWIYSSEEAKEVAMKRMMESSSGPGVRNNSIDAASDPGYHSDDSAQSAPPGMASHHRRSESDVGQRASAADQNTPPSSPGQPPVVAVGDPNRNYAKTLRLTSDQLKALDLQPGENVMSFTVNRATCSAYMYLWKHEIPVVISDIDGTITKSDALGHVLNMIGRDWTHAGVAKLYSDIVANGYNIMYLTSRSVGQADSTRTYLHGITQEGYKLPRGPTILSPDRTMAALRREIYLRKPEVFKMATLRDIRNLYGIGSHPFYAGFGNRLTDQISYRTVDVPRNRIFTINANAEVSLDLLSLNQMKLTYVNITEVVDHYFPPIGTLVKGGGEEYTDFKYWRDDPLEVEDFSDSESEEEDKPAPVGRGRKSSVPIPAPVRPFDEDDDDEEEEEDLDDDEAGEDMADSYISHNSVDEYGEGSILSGGGEDEDEPMTQSMVLGDDEGETEEEMDEDEDEEEDDEDEDDDEDTDDALSPIQRKSASSSKLDMRSSASSSSRTRLNRETSHVSHATAEDVGAELITGVKNLSVDTSTASGKKTHGSKSSLDEDVD